MKQLRWKDFSLVSKIVIEVGMIAVLLFAMNMLFYVRINNSMQKMDNVYASNAELTELSQVFEKVQDNMYKYLKVKNSQTLLDYYQNEAKYRNELEKLNEDNINDPVKLLERNIRKMSETYLDCTAETVAAKRGRNVEQYKRKYDDATKLYRYILCICIVHLYMEISLTYQLCCLCHIGKGNKHISGGLDEQKHSTGYNYDHNN